MDEKWKKLIDCVAQLRDAMKECDNILSCEVRTEYGTCDKVACQDGFYSTVHAYSKCNVPFESKRPFDCQFDEHYSVLNGVKVFCLVEKEEAT